MVRWLTRRTSGAYNAWYPVWPARCWLRRCGVLSLVLTKHGASIVVSSPVLAAQRGLLGVRGRKRAHAQCGLIRCVREKACPTHYGMVYSRTGGGRTGGYWRVARRRELPRGDCHCPQALSTPSLDYESFLLVYVSFWPVGGFALACRNFCVPPAVALPQLAACLATVLIE